MYMTSNKKQVSPKLYKYISLEKDAEVIIESIFMKNEVKVTNPKDFNDPFDCQISFDKHDTSIDAYRIVAGLGIEKSVHTKTLPKHQQKEIIDANCQSEDFKGFMMNTLKELVLETSNHVRICSLTIDYKSILMWSHYADNHRGIVIELDYELLSNHFYMIDNVIYSEKFPKLDEIFGDYTPSKENNANLYGSLFFRKGEQWFYEGEVRALRVIADDEEMNIIATQTNIVKSVFFGVEVDPLVKKKILRVINDNKSETICYQMVKNDQSYQLIPKNVSI